MLFCSLLAMYSTAGGIGYYWDLFFSVLLSIIGGGWNCRSQQLITLYPIQRNFHLTFGLS